MTITFADLFTGGGGVSLGAIAAGLTPIWGIEKDPVIAWYGGENTRFYKSDHKVLIADLLSYSKMDFGWKIIQKKYDSPDWLHASPPCVNASRANNGKETSEDLGLAEAICRAIAILKPKYFSLENVAGYMNFDAFLFIEKRLLELGYTYDYKVLDCAEYGVPQSRKRLFLVASSRNCRSTFFFWERLKKQEPVGCVEAITDVIPSLPECELTEAQKGRLGRFLKNVYIPRLNKHDFSNLDIQRLPNLAIQNAGNRKNKNNLPTNTIRLANEPIWTLRAMSGNVRPNPHQVTLIVDGKVLRPSIECYSRWQTFPDSYQWSNDFKLAMKICGNAVPPFMFQQIVEAVLND